MSVTAAFPYITVDIVPPPPPVAQRAPGVIAIVGKTPNGANGGSQPANMPISVETLADAANYFTKVSADGSVAGTDLYNSIVLAMEQTPRPSKIYGVRVSGDDYAAALSSIEGIDDITFVSLANEKAVGTADANTGLSALKKHIESVSANGSRRIGVAMIDNALPKTNSYVGDVMATVATAPDSLKSDVGRMIMVAARGATQDVATAAMAAIAGYEPQVSIVLKGINGIQIPKGSEYSPSEIMGLAGNGIIPLIAPALMVGDSLHFGDGQTFSGNATYAYIDFVRVLDDLEYRMKAGLIGSIGDARITKAGMTGLKIRLEGILGPIQRRSVIDDYAIDIPVLTILSMPDSARTSTDSAILTAARADRKVDVIVTIKYGPAVHRLGVQLVVKF